MQGGEAIGDFIVTCFMTMWSFLTFVVLAIYHPRLARLRLMGAGGELWFVGYAAIVCFLLPEMRSGRGARPPTSARCSTAASSTPSPTSVAVKLFDSGRREHAYIRDGLEHLSRRRDPPDPGGDHACARPSRCSTAS